jgi:hypothetical protein
MSNVPRGLGVFLVYFFIGPPVAAMLIAIALFVSSPPAGDGGASVGGLLYGGLALLVGYSLGALPSLVTGAVAAFASSRIRQGWLWVALSTVLGGGLAWLFGFSNWPGLPLKPGDLQGGLVAFGGLTSLICALICLAWRPRRAVVEAAA